MVCTLILRSLLLQSRDSGFWMKTWRWTLQETHWCDHKNLPNSGEGGRSISTSEYVLRVQNTKNMVQDRKSPKVEMRAPACCYQQLLCFKFCLFANLLEKFLTWYFRSLRQAGTQEGRDVTLASSRSECVKLMRWSAIPISFASIRILKAREATSVLSF